MATIYSWNPYNKRLHLPLEKVTIHGIESFEAARNLVNSEGFNPSDYQFVVQTKTGKPTNFNTKEAALDYAEKKSNKRSAYVVYNDGHAIAAFMDKKPLTNWVTVFETPVAQLPSKKSWYESTPSRKGAYKKWHIKTTVDTAIDKVRLCHVYVTWYKLRNGVFTSKVSKATITFHKNGAVYWYAEGRVVHRSAYDISLEYEDYDVVETLRNELTKLRPELKAILLCASIDRLVAAFAHPTCLYGFDTYHKRCSPRETHLPFKYYPKEIVDESQINALLAKKLRIPFTKGLKKAYTENVHNMFVVKCLKDCGFKDVNSYKKLVGFGIYLMSDSIDSYEKFFKRFIEIRTENTVVRMTSDSGFDLIHDTARSYSFVDEAVSDLILRDARNFEEIHDSFNMSLRENSLQVDKKIKYTDDENNTFNYVCDDGVRFELAKSSKDLAVVGYNMGICVGGYANAALAKRTTIVKMMDGKEYAGCIEIHGKMVVQLKAKFNNPIRIQYKHDIDEWMSHGKLVPECSDYQNIGGEWYSSYNYARVRPADFVPEGHHPMLQIVKRNHTHFIHNNTWFTRHDVGGKQYTRMCEDAVNPNEVHIEPVDADELPFA